MISFEAARSLVIEHAHPLPIATVALEEAAGRFLAEEIKAPFDMPRFDNSAVDGFCVRLADVEKASNETPVALRLAGTIRAGEAGGRGPGAGEAVKIMTGAPVPQGTEAAVMREFCEESSGTVTVHRSAQAGENIRRAGGEYRQGQTVLSAGTRCSPPVLGQLVSLGMTGVAVHARPRVAIISTGDELVAPGGELGEAGVYDGNSVALAAACHALGVRERSVRHVSDKLEAVIEVLRQAVSEADVVITVGGVSVGDYDFVRDALAAVGAHTHFTRVAMKPGKPNVFATAPAQDASGKTRLLFGLPGNPVSALVSFHHFVRPALLLLMGAREVSPLLVSARMGTPLRKRAGRLEFVRATLAYEEGGVIAYPTGGQDSHMLGGLCAAQCLVHFPAEAVKLDKDEPVTVELLSW
ncbi:MAG: molybdopterin molybdotransferase MoeA [bacterium]|nr:molybdopterin molybdotransferase MoeA [bacterium]